MTTDITSVPSYADAIGAYQAVRIVILFGRIIVWVLVNPNVA